MAGSIQTYNKKRNFRKTAEPRGEVSAPSKGLPKFVIQKHDASHLHYDFRLEIGGVLTSWAIPKGPSLDPGEKRLAVRTEDHPMKYGSFEGTIPEDEYGGGTVMLWDQGSYKPAGNARDGLKKGDLKFELRGKRLRGSFVLARMRPRGNEKRENWLLIKHRDATAKPGSKDAVVREHTDSVETARAMEEIAEGEAVWHSNRVGKKKAGKKKEEKVVTPPKHRIFKVDVAKLKGAKKGRLPAKISPQLATLVEEPPPGKGWISEIKFDGYRMVARIDNGKVKIYSRNGNVWTTKLPTIAKSLAKLKVKQAWLDGEIVVLDDEGKSSFSKLKDALGGEDQRNIFFFAFDILHLDGYNTMGCSQVDRKRLLESVLGDAPPPFIRYSDHMAEAPEAIQQRACQMHLEGIIVKQADAPYRQARTRSWLKLKCVQREEFVVIGYTDPQGTRAGFGALHLGYYDKDGELHYAGGVGTGFNTKKLVAMEKTLAKMTRRIPPAIWIHGEKPPSKMHWVRLEMVVETQFIDWTGAGSVRHAVFMGIREDKMATDVVRDPPTVAKSRFSGTGTIVRAAKVKPKAKKKGKTAPKARGDVPEIIDNRQADNGAVRLTHPDRVLWPKQKLTKRDLADYWKRAAPFALPFIVNRPLALVRTPDGIDGEQFFQKKISRGFPRQILDLELEGEQLIAIDGPDGFQALAQMSAIELHPWGSSVEDISTPDVIVMDLDPDAGLDFEDVIQAARDLRDALKAVGLTSFCKTTGGKGLHVVVPFQPQLGWDEVKAFAKSIATAFATSDPKRFTDALAKKARKGRIFIDYLRNGRGATAVAPFSPRARPGATIAMPLTWTQVKPGLDPADYTIQLSEKQLRAGAAAWKDYFDIRKKQRITDKMQRAFKSV